jgi:branched-chain amino acid transport system substrate-binding protein
MRRSRALVPAVALLAALAACEDRKPAAGAPQAPAPGAKVRFGYVASMTGPEAAFGDSTEKGIQLAIEELNARGGLKGRQVDLKTYDDHGKPEEAASAAARLVTQDKVAVLLGEVASSRRREALPVASIAEANRVPMIAPSSTSPRLTRDGDRGRAFVFRACFVDPVQGAAMARFVREKGVTRVAILRDVGNASSVDLADHFLSRFKQLGGAIVNDQSYKAGDQDFKAQLTAIRARAPEAVYVPGHSADVAVIARQARDLGIKVPLMGGDEWDSARLLELVGPALEGSWFSNHYAPDDPSPRVTAFVARFKARFGAVPDARAATGYDAAMLAADAIVRARNDGGDALAQAIAETKDFPGVTGVITLDGDHNAVKPAVVLEVKGGKAVYVATMSPDSPAAPAAAPVPASAPAN